MEFVIDKSELVRELQTITGVVEKRATMPILANLLLEATGGGLQLGASDLEVTVRGTAKATVMREGSMTLPAAKLHEIARSLPDAEVQFKLLERSQVAITCERTRYRIAGQPRDEFPKFPEVDASRGMRLPARTFNLMIERVAFAIAAEDAGYSLAGALIQVQRGKLTLVATDGHRLAYVAKELDQLATAGDLKVVVPRKALNEFSKLTAAMSDDEEVVFGRSDGQVFFIAGQHRLTSSVLDREFPRYENVMPAKCATVVALDTGEFAQAVRRVSVLASDRNSRAARLLLATGKLELSSETDMGEAHETLAVSYDGPDVRIGFNARYLLDFLSVVGCATVRLELNPLKANEEPDAQRADAGDKPGQLRPEADYGMDYRYIVMPMHL